jgi:hypothetical protein
MRRNFLSLALAAALTLAPLAAWGQSVQVPNVLPVPVVTSTSDPTVNDDSGAGRSVGQRWVNTATGRSFAARDVTVGAAVWVQEQTSTHPGYVSGRWYGGSGNAALTNTSSAPNSTNTYFLPVFLSSKATITDLAFNVATLGGNAKLAIYGTDYANMKPTGAALCTSGTVDVSTTGVKSPSIASCPALQGLIWIAQQYDNSATRLVNFATGSTYYAWLLGSATSGNITGAGTTNAFGLSVGSTTFGTMPTLSPGTFTEETAYRWGLVNFKVQ